MERAVRAVDSAGVAERGERGGRGASCTHARARDSRDDAEGVQQRVLEVAREPREAVGLKRNAAVVLGNIGDERDVEVLTRALDDEEPLVREHAAWALVVLTGGRGTPE